MLFHLLWSSLFFGAPRAVSEDRESDMFTTARKAVIQLLAFLLYLATRLSKRSIGVSVFTRPHTRVKRIVFARVLKKERFFIFMCSL